jgi:hypothetical protein
MTRLLFSAALVQKCPPWLQRTFGGPFMRGLGDILDTLVDETVQGVKIRFPVDDGDALALATIGRERRIRRGPSEAANTYASRIRVWLDSHRTRGNVYALATQLYLYLRAGINPAFEIVSAKGNRLSVDTAGAMTRDQLAIWAPSGGWSNIWIFFHVTSAQAAAAAADHETYAAVPREWSAAHIKDTTLVFLHDSGRVIGYPPSDTIGDGYVLGDDPAVIFTTDGP